MLSTALDLVKGSVSGDAASDGLLDQHAQYSWAMLFVFVIRVPFPLDIVVALASE